MSTKKRQQNKLIYKSFLETVEELCGLSPQEVYRALNWDRRAYYAQRKRQFFPMKHLEELRAAVYLDVPQFYTLLSDYLLFANKKP